MYVYNTQHLLYIYTYIYSFYSIISHCCRSNILAFVWLNQSFGFNLVSPLVFRNTPFCVANNVRIFVVQHTNLTSPCLFVNLQIILMIQGKSSRKSCYISITCESYTEFTRKAMAFSPAAIGSTATLKSKPPRLVQWRTLGWRRTKIALVGSQCPKRNLEALAMSFIENFGVKSDSSGQFSGIFQSNSKA